MYTILLATHNGDRFLKELLESIKNQTTDDWQLIVSDDSSTDYTLEVLKAFKREFPNKVKIYANNKFGSAKLNFAFLFKLAKKLECEYVLPADQDDVWYPEKIEIMAKFMKRLEERFGEKTPLIVHSDLNVCDEKLNVISESFFEYSRIEKKSSIYRLISQNNVTGCASMMNTEVVKNTADFLDRDECLMHDYWCALYASVFGRIVLIDKPLVYYRQHSDNTLGAQKAYNPIRLYKRLRDGRKAYMKDVNGTRNQCKEFYKIYSDALEDQSKHPGMVHERSYKYIRASLALMREFGNLGVKSKLQRIKFYIDYKAWKKGVARIIMQILWS